MRSPISRGGADERLRIGAGRPDAVGRVGLTEVVEHECPRQYGSGGVGLARSRDVGGRAVDRLEHRDPSGVQVGRAGEADAAAHRTTEVGEDVAEEVVGDDHVVALRVLHEVDAGGVDVVVGGLDLGELLGHLVERALPEIAGEGQARWSCGTS